MFGTSAPDKWAAIYGRQSVCGPLKWDEWEWESGCHQQHLLPTRKKCIKLDQIAAKGNKLADWQKVLAAL